MREPEQEAASTVRGSLYLLLIYTVYYQYSFLGVRSFIIEGVTNTS